MEVTQKTGPGLRGYSGIVPKGEDLAMDQMKKTFEEELESLINRHSKENESNTPDFILAQYIAGCFAVFNTAVQQRERWYGRDPRPTSPFTRSPFTSGESDEVANSE